MKKYYLLFVFVFTSGFLMAQWTKTITYKDGTTQTVTKTIDKQLREVYTEEFRDKNGKVTKKTIYKKDLRNRTEVEGYDAPLDKGQTEHRLSVTYYSNEKGEWIKVRQHARNGKFNDIPRNSDGTFGPDDDDRMAPVTIQIWENGNIDKFKWFDKLDKEEKKKCKDKKVTFYIGPSLLNGDFGSSKESFFGGQAYGLVSINSKIGIGADFSLNSKKNGDQKFTRSLILARGQYDFFTGDKCDKGIIPEAHILIGLGSESFKFTSSGNTSESSQSGLAYGVGAGVGINISPKINLGISVDYVSIKFENTNSANSNIRASAGIKIGI